MLRIYRRLWQVNWAEQWQYRANLLMYLLYFLVSPIVYLAVWTAVANSQGAVNGLTANDFAAYYLTLLIVDNLTSDITIHSLGYKIQDGTLSGELLKPIHPILTGVLMGNLAFKALTLMALIPIWLGLCLLIRPDFSAVTLGSVLMAAPAVGLGVLISFLLGATITCIGFWTTRIHSLAELYFAIVVLFGGQFVPLDLMPRLIQNVAQFLPFKLFYYVPIQIVLGRLPVEAAMREMALGAAWLILALILFQTIWRSGLKRFSAVGA